MRSLGEGAKGSLVAEGLGVERTGMKHRRQTADLRRSLVELDDRVLEESYCYREEESRTSPVAKDH